VTCGGDLRDDLQGVQYGNVFVGKRSRLSEEHCTVFLGILRPAALLFVKQLPHIIGPLGRLCHALLFGQQKKLLRTRDVDAAASFRQQARIVFDWTEDWSDFYQDESLMKLQERAVREADAVITVAEPLAERARKLRGDDRVLYLPNATALPVLPDIEEHADLKGVAHPRIGYLGHLGPWFDANLLRRLAVQKPDYSFVLVGGVSGAAAKQLDGLSNVYCPGLYPLDELPAFLAGFDVCIAPYIGENIQGDASKLYDYFTCGKPVVTTPVPGVQRFGDTIHVASGEDAWVDAMEQCVNAPCVSEERLALAKFHSWDHRAIELLDWLSGLEE
jgi:glycosyltransferase involved in cell wall biosynthesis